MRCRRRLAPLTEGPFYLIGADLETVATPAWQQRAATALAALLWATLPVLPPVSDEASRSAQFYTVGAATQAFPAAPLIRTLALFTAREAVQARLTPPTDTNQTEPDPALASLTALVTQLFTPTAALPTLPLPPVRLRRAQPRWWRNSARPVAMLLAYQQQQQYTQQLAARQARTNWLTTQLAQWDAAWQAMSRIAPRPVEHRIDPLHDTVLFSQLRRQLLALAQEVDDGLADLALTIDVHEATTQRECAALTTLCADLPTLSPLGIWHFCRQPPQWPRWLWQLTVGLPWRLRRLSRCLTAQERRCTMKPISINAANWPWP